MTRRLCAALLAAAFLAAGCDTGPKEIAPFATDFAVRDTDGIDRPPRPQTFGLPLARGELNDVQMETLRLLAGGEPVEADFSAAQRWSDGSVRWLHVDAMMPPLPAYGQMPLRIDNAQLPQYPRPIDQPVRVRLGTETPTLDISNGPLRFLLRGNGARVIDELRYHHTTARSNSPILMRGVDAALTAQLDGAVYRGEPNDAARPRVLFQSAFKSVVQTAGQLIGPGGVRGLDYEIITTVYTGTPILKLQVTLINRAGLEPGDKVDLGDASLLLPVRLGPAASATVSRHGPALRVNAADAPRVVAADSGRWFADIRKGDQRTPRGGGDPLRDRPVGLGWIDVAIPGERGVAVGMDDFWQSNPRSLGVTADGSIEIGLFAGKAAGRSIPMHLGVARTTELTVLIHEGLDSTQLRRFFLAADTPAIPLAAPDRYASTRVYGPIAPATADFGQFAGIARRYDFALATSLQKIQGREGGVTYNNVSADAFSWLSWGDTLHWAFGPASDPMHLQWDAAHYDYPWAMILQGVRTGDVDFVRRGLLGAAYGYDVHTAHLDANDPRTGAPRVSPARGHVAGESPAPQVDQRIDWMTGLSTVAAWQLAGDWRARLVADEQFARALRTTVDGEGWDSPRGAGNHIAILLAAAEMTGDDRYRGRAEAIVARGVRTINDTGDLPDKAANRYRFGVGLEGLLWYAWSGDRVDESVADAIRKVVDTALERGWKGYNVNMAAACGFCWQQTGEEKYLDAMVRLLEGVDVTSRTKYFGVRFRTTPHALGYLQRAATK